MILTSSDLINIRDIAKQLKARDFVVYYNRIISLDNFPIIYGYIQFDPMMLHGIINIPLVFSYSELNKFCKTIPMESFIEFNEPYRVKYIRNGDTLLTLSIMNNNDLVNIQNYMNGVQKNYMPIYNNIDITQQMQPLKDMTINDGCIMIPICGIIVSLSPTLFKLNKADKVYVSIFDYSIDSYIFKYMINNKNNQIVYFVKYLKL
jgi:hypothetical protein